MKRTTKNKSLKSVSKLYKNAAKASAKANQGLAKYIANKKDSFSTSSIDPFNVGNAFWKAFEELYSDPQKVVTITTDLAKNYIELISNVAHRALGEGTAPLFAPDERDKRFQDPEWNLNPIFDFIRQSYKLNAMWLMGTMDRLNTLPPKEAQKVHFYTQLFIDSMSPSNFAVTNPTVIKEALATGGESLLKGAEHFYHDLAHSKDTLKITTVDEQNFAVGKNLAITAGKVVYQNDLMQLIQYEANTPKVYSVPILVIPAWINKYYILDLQQKNSFIKWLVDQGYTVYMISWVNPTAYHSDKDFFSYMNEGPIAAIEQIKRLANIESINLIGYCLGGTLLASLIAYLKAKKNKPFPIVSASFLASLVDFKDAGDLTVFIDEEQISSLEKRMSEKGYMEASDMAQTFSIIRANDMIWSFYVNNYLLGKDPLPFDILYWNADPTRLPAKMHSYYLRNMYQNNLLAKPGKVKLNKVNIDLSKNDIPSYVLATRNDHIVPWESAYIATQLYSGPIRFVLSGSGHVAGVVNHPDNKKYNYWSNDKLSKSASEWLKNAKDNQGSWWLDWHKWCSKLSGEMISARKINQKSIIEDAPGSYVKVKLDN
jgi:polyhydroxyalkanoate synthase